MTNVMYGISISPFQGFGCPRLRRRFATPIGLRPMIVYTALSGLGAVIHHKKATKWRYKLTQGVAL